MWGASGRTIRMITVPGSCPAMQLGRWCAMAWAARAAGGKPRSAHAMSSSAAFRSSTASALPVKRRLFEKALLSANRYVFQKALREESLAGMGTTAVCALVRGGKAYLSHAGDSRAYLYRDGKLAQLTHDHSYVQELVDCGTITQEQAEHHPQKTSSPGRWAWITGWNRSSPLWRCRQGMCCCCAQTA